MNESLYFLQKKSIMRGDFNASLLAQVVSKMQKKAIVVHVQ